jgi:hypothetical protein
MDLGEVGWCDVDWIGLDQDMKRWRAVVNSVYSDVKKLKKKKKKLNSMV